MSDNPENIIEKIKSDAFFAGMNAFGVCNLEELCAQYPGLLDNLPGGFTRGLVFGIPVPSGCLEAIVDEPTLIYFHHYRQLNYILDRFAAQAAVALSSAGYKAVAVPASQILTWTPIARGHISHRLLAQAAGLGWRGRNNLLVTKEHGSQIRLVSILTDMPFEASNSQPESGCGECRACLEKCPAGAIKEDPKDFDAQACSEKLREFSKIQFIGQRICGVCVKACKPH